MSATEVIFPLGGPRLTTIILLAVFVAIAITREQRLPFYACLAWLFGFEAVFEATMLAQGRNGHLGPLHAIFYILVGAVLLPWAYRRGVETSWPLLLAAGVVFGVWVATGFHVNGHGGARGIDIGAEVLNEVSKVLWGLAYLLPVLRSDALPETDTERLTRDAAATDFRA